LSDFDFDYEGMDGIVLSTLAGSAASDVVPPPVYIIDGILADMQHKVRMTRASDSKIGPYDVVPLFQSVDKPHLTEYVNPAAEEYGGEMVAALSA